MRPYTARKPIADQADGVPGVSGTEGAPAPADAQAPGQGQAPEPAQAQVLDDGRVLLLVVHRTDRLKPDIITSHPLVRVHVVDADSGLHLGKQTSYALRSMRCYYFLTSLFSTLKAV